MTPERLTATGRIDAEPDATVQLLVADAGNRTAIREMLEDRFEVDTSRSVGDADLYLVEDHLFARYRAELRDRVDRAHPAFCPVVLIRRETTTLAHDWDAPAGDGRLLVDEVVDAPVDRLLLIRRLHSLLVRRRQSRELMDHVSALEERDRTLRRFERGVEASGSGIAITDPDGKIEYVNPAFEAITGYTEEAVRGRTPRLLQPDDAIDAFDETFWRTMRDRSEWAGEVVIECHDGTRCVADVEATAFDDDGGRTEGFVVVMSDITERIQREQELRAREQELDLLRQILTRYLRHNLRNDLNVILGHGELLADADTLSTRQREWADRIVAATNRLMEKSDTARTYSALLASDEEPSPRDLSDIVTDAVRTVRAAHPDVEIDIDVPDTCPIQARKGVTHAVEELIENAARHNDAASPWLRIRIRNADGPRLVIEDNGPGIPDLEIESLERGGETALSHSQGIGLWLSKWVIEEVDGQLAFETTDTGTRVRVEFPPPERVSATRLDVPDLKQRERRLETIIDRVTDAIVEVDASWNLTFLDDRAEEILGVDAEEILGNRFWEVFSDTRGTRFEEVYREAMESRSSTGVEAYHPGIDGWLDVYVYPEFHGGLALYLRDVTERNERKRELRRARSRMELALSVTGATVWEWDFRTDTVTTHPETHTALGIEVSTGDEFVEGIHPEDRARVEETLKTAIETHTPYHAEYRVQDGETIRWVEDYGEVHPGRGDVPERMVGIAMDVTDRTERERELRERIKELTAIHDTTRAFEATDAPLEEVLAEFVGSIPDSFQYPDAAAARLEYDGYEVSTSGFEQRERMLSAHANTSDGSTLVVDVVYVEAVPEHGDGPFIPEERELMDTLVRLAAGYVERRTYLTELERTEDLLTNAERMGDVGAWEVDLETGDVHLTGGARRIHEAPETFDPTVDAILEFVHPEDRETLIETVEESLEADEPFDLELRLRTMADDDRWVRIEGEPADGRRVVRGYVQDVTDRRTRNRRYEAIFNQTYQFTGLMDPDGTLIEANDTALDFGGLTKADVRGEKLWNTPWFEISEEIRRQTKADVERAAEGTFVRRELEVQGEDGTAIIDFSIRPITDEDGDVVLLVPEGRDITDRTERMRELEQRRDLLEHTERLAGVAGWEIDAATREVVWSQNLHDIAGVEYGDDPSLAATLRIYHEEDRSRVERAFERACHEGEPFDIEARSRLPDGEIQWLRVQCEPVVRDGEVTKLRGVLQDVTERKEYEERLERQNERVEAFASIVSHDLRNPLNVAQGRLELAHQEHESEHIAAVGRAHGRMEALIDDVLALAREGEAAVETESLSLPALLKRCWNNVETGDSTLEVETDRRIRADTSRLKRLLENLFRNAVEHGGGGVTIRVGDLPDGSGFYVEDDGPGIPTDEREQVLEAGYTTAEEGTGLGLAIVREIVETHGWDIRVTDGRDGGTRFEIGGVD
jgi:PAS domain S-box-containing protein